MLSRRTRNLWKYPRENHFMAQNEGSNRRVPNSRFRLSAIFSYKDTCLTYTNITHCIYSWLSTFNTSCVSIFIARALFHAETKSAVKHFAWQFAELLTVVLLLFFRFLGGMASFPQKSLPGCKQRRVKVMCSCKYGKEVKKEQVTDCPQQAKNHFSVCICMYIYRID